jgi:hypothetical protein
MAMVDITTLSKKDINKYNNIISFIEKYWEELTLDELMFEVKIKFNVDITKHNIDTIRKARELPSKSNVSSSKRKLYMVEIPPKLARAIFLKHWDMRSFKTVEEIEAINKEFGEKYYNGLNSREIEKYGKTFGITERDREVGTNVSMNEARIENRRK